MRPKRCWRGGLVGTAGIWTRRMGEVRGGSSVGRRMDSRSMICTHSS